MPRPISIIFIILIVGFAFVFACTQDNNDEDDSDSSLKVPLLVLQDDYFDFQENDVIGNVEYWKSRGPVGSRVEAVCTIDTLRTFLEAYNSQSISVKLILQNADAARGEFTPVEWDQDSNSHQFRFYIPLVETVPVLLNFRVLLYRYSDDADDDVNDDADDDTDGAKADDDTADDDTASPDDDTADDDTSDDDSADDDVNDDSDDDTTDDDTASGPIFEAAADFLFVVNDGQPGTGD